MRIGSVYWSAGPSQTAPYGAASSPKGRAKVASLRRNDAAKLQFAEMLSQTDMPITIQYTVLKETETCRPRWKPAGFFYSIFRMLDLGTAPMDWLTILPFLMTSRVGMLLMPYLAASCGS